MIGQELNINEEGFTLQSLIDMNVVDYVEQIVSKSVEATGQAKLRNQLGDLIEIWKGVQFTTKNYKEKDNQFILVDIDTLYQYLDEGLAAINMILGNRFVKVMRPEAEKVKKELNILDEAVKQWVEVQRQWCYLENIFNGGTIKTYLPEESKLFDQVNKIFLALNLKANRTPQCLRMIRSSTTLVDQLKKQNEDLEKIQKKLELYVESKREIFPRFYFLSFEDLIQILSNSENKDVISLHLKTLFDGIVALEFKDDVILKMFSKEKECVELSKPVKTRAAVETWLLNLSEEMKTTVYRKVKEGQKAYTDDTRKDWVLQHPGQVVAAVA
jgi:dynein heavy chain